VNDDETGRPHVGVQRVIARGDIDVETAEQLREELDGVLSSGAVYVILDASDVNFIDSSGLRVIVDVGNRLRERNGQLMIEGISAAVSRILELTGLLERYRGTADPPV